MFSLGYFLSFFTLNWLCSENRHNFFLLNPLIWGFLLVLVIKMGKEVIIEATLLRLRPVLMTAFTTLFGILPLLYATGVGSEIQYPLSVVIVGGIISSTILTLLVLPVGYLVVYRK